MKYLSEDLQVHNNLNPKLWNSDNELLPEVREKIISIVKQFEEDLDNIPINIVDIQLVGSNCSFNYTDHSDLDVHIMCNFEVIPINPEILQTVYNVKKTEFNKNYDISIKGIEVEMYVQDIKSSTTSNGIYSLCDDEWIKFPKPITNITHYDTSEEVSKWKKKIEHVLLFKDREDIVNAINTLYLMRTNSIQVDGEYGKGNQIFKDIRNLGLLDELKKALKEATARELSMESFIR